ncbi:MAG: hypothetical protein NT061_06830 [Spirochaetes bacterium]|nr:hypothetical protein [Spirochaetota bacterium]
MYRIGENPAGSTLPRRREEICLNGEWPLGGSIPRYLPSATDFDYSCFPDIASETCSRKVYVPASWDGKQICVEFNAVNFIAEIFVNDFKVDEHIGGWIPFSVDITNHVRAGAEFELELKILGRANKPYSDENGLPRWPVGDIKKKMDNRFTGIVDDVYLRAYGEIKLQSPRIVTSYRQENISVEYEAVNSTQRPRRVHLACEIFTRPEGAPLLSFSGDKVEIPAGSSATISASSTSRGLETWRPDRPTLYILQSKIVEDSDTIDSETRRFGFREIWIEGKHFLLNGIRLNLRGDFVEFGEDLPVEKFYPENWRRTVRDLKALNLNSFRPHKYPCPEFVLDIADEEGLIIITEAAVTGDSPLWRDERMDLSAFIKNFKEWIGSWVKATRNHASVLIRAAANEMYSVPAEDCLAINEIIHSFDDTRPVEWEDRDDIRDCLDIVNHHYPRPLAETTSYPWNSEPWNWGKGAYEAWKEFLEPHKPIMMGEGLNVPGTALPNEREQRNTWWQGVWCRVMRYQDWAEIAPSSAYGWICKLVSPNDIRVTNYRNAMNPVALFDKEYDGLGIAPFVTGLTPGGEAPEVAAGVPIVRRLVLYNDEFESTMVTAGVEIKRGGQSLFSGSAVFDVELGGHIELYCEFQIPDNSHASRPEADCIEMVMRTFKGGKQRYEEARRFTVCRAIPSALPALCFQSSVCITKASSEVHLSPAGDACRG